MRKAARYHVVVNKKGTNLRPFLFFAVSRGTAKINKKLWEL
ncbi:niacin/nicotinamide transporter NaiP [Bacillus cereus Rock4-18]|jgi:hypothetical protein|nr:hypothetical protein bcere0019_51250 [Bacillus cereus Rock3-28]PKR94219.1 niacin/nicotinamide transporter NaiP [Bacillus cereus Rock4-18]